jgi:hypothetical protein
MQGDPEVTQFQNALGCYEDIPGRDVSMDRATLMNPGDGSKQPDDLSSRPRLRPRFRIPFEVAAKIPLFHILGDQAIEWCSTPAVWHPRKRVVHLDEGWDVPKQMAKVCFPVPGRRVDRDL